MNAFGFNATHKEKKDIGHFGFRQVNLAGVWEMIQADERPAFHPGRGNESAPDWVSEIPEDLDGDGNEYFYPAKGGNKHPYLQTTAENINQGPWPRDPVGDRHWYIIKGCVIGYHNDIGNKIIMYRAECEVKSSRKIVTVNNKQTNLILTSNLLLTVSARRLFGDSIMLADFLSFALRGIQLSIYRKWSPDSNLVFLSFSPGTPLTASGVPN
jgi:hypothetical protein